MEAAEGKEKQKAIRRADTSKSMENELVDYAKALDEQKAKLEVWNELFTLLLQHRSDKVPSKSWPEHFNALLGRDLEDVPLCFQDDLPFQEAVLKVGELISRLRLDIAKGQKVLENKRKRANAFQARGDTELKRKKAKVDQWLERVETGEEKAVQSEKKCLGLASV